MKSVAVAIGAICVLSVLPAVLGHAALVSPTAFNPQPVKTFKCGGPSSGAVTTITAGAQNIQWRLIAGDGNGPNPVRINLISNTATNNLPANYNDPGTGVTQITTNVVPAALETYTIAYDMPAITCTGTMGSRTDVCIGQVVSDTNWVACFAFSQNPPPSTGGASGPTGTCTTATGLVACSMVNGRRVNVPDGESLQSLDLQVSESIALNLNNTRVFLHGGVPAAPGVEQTPCERSYRHYLCGSVFGNCAVNNNPPPAPQPCGPVCKQFECWCGMNPIHAGLYICEALTNYGRDNAGDCSQGFGPLNSTCAASSTGVNGCEAGVLGDCSSAPSLAGSPVALAFAAVAALLARRFL